MSATAPKVVIINTQYVETDAVSFKDVVQKLTGKNSTATEADGDGRPPKKIFYHNSQNSSKASTHDHRGADDLVLKRDISFKEFDTLLREMPPIDELWVD